MAQVKIYASCHHREALSAAGRKRHSEEDELNIEYGVEISVGPRSGGGA